MLIRHLKSIHYSYLSNLATTKGIYSRQFTSIKSEFKMGEKTGVALATIVEKLEGFAATKTAEGWDNVGLLVDPMTENPIKKILLTNDLTEDVLKEAINHQVGMIISYHPPIFRGLKTLNTKTWKERIIIQCLKHSIAIFSPHTSWDIVEGGVNDWLADSLTPKSSEPLTESGAGRFCHLSEPLSIRNAVEKIKKHIGQPYVQLALAVGKNMDSPISTVALCAGSGATVLGSTAADLYLTGEMSHHEVLDAAHRGVHVVLCNHSNSERGFLKVFSNILKDNLLNGKVDVVVSEKDADPLKTV